MCVSGRSDIHISGRQAGYDSGCLGSFGSVGSDRVDSDLVGIDDDHNIIISTPLAGCMIEVIGRLVILECPGAWLFPVGMNDEVIIIEATCYHPPILIDIHILYLVSIVS